MPLRIPQGGWTRWRCCAWHRSPAPSADSMVRCRSIHADLFSVDVFYTMCLHVFDGRLEATNVRVQATPAPKVPR